MSRCRLGALRPGALVSALTRLERFVYDCADAVTVISPGMEANLRAKGVTAERLALIPNQVEAIDPPADANGGAFSAAHGLNGRFVVTYAGNIGKPQAVEVVVSAAAASGTIRLSGSSSSETTEREATAAQIRAAGLSNVIMVPYQPFSMVPEIYASSHVCLVLQAAGTGTSALPSKAVQVGAGRPIIAVTDASSDLATFVVSVAGLVVFRADRTAGQTSVSQMQLEYATWSKRSTPPGVREGGVLEGAGWAPNSYTRVIERLVEEVGA